MKFRNLPNYRGEFYVALTIPATEDRDVIPCDAVKLHESPHSAFRLVFNVLYALGDIDFAREHARSILREHPTWSAGLYRRRWVSGRGSGMNPIHRTYNGVSLWHDRFTGYIDMRRLIQTETGWFASAGREFGLWYVMLHGFGLHFGVIGPFRLKREVTA